MTGRFSFGSEHSMRTHSKSFSAAARWLPSDVRPDVELLYAVCRSTDDAVDVGVGDTNDIIAQKRAQLDAIYSGLPLSDPLWASFGQLCQNRKIPRLYPDELLNGMGMDVCSTPYPDMESLFTYAFRVAGVVGLMMCHITGLSCDLALRDAATLGIAMQLTNICRDVAEDWARGRLYIPETVLRASGISGLRNDLGGKFPESAEKQLQMAVRKLLGFADLLYSRAMRGIAALDIQTGIAVRVAAFLYRAIGHNLRDQGANPLLARATTTPMQKVHLGVSAITVEVLVRAGGGFGHVGTKRRIPDSVLTLNEMLQTLPSGL